MHHNFEIFEIGKRVTKIYSFEKINGSEYIQFVVETHNNFGLI